MDCFLAARQANPSGFIAALSLIVIIWVPVYNTAFDRIEHLRTGRAASGLPDTLRVVHALCLEITAAAVTLPLIMAMGGHILAGADH